MIKISLQLWRISKRATSLDRNAKMTQNKMPWNLIRCDTGRLKKLKNGNMTKLAIVLSELESSKFRKEISKDFTLANVLGAIEK